MAHPLRTNPALAHLAYRKTVIHRTMAFLRRQFLGDEASEPRETLICEEVYPVDSHVPPESIQHYIEGLAEEVAKLDLEIRQFDFIPGRQHEQQTSQKAAGQSRQKGHQRHRQGNRTH